MQATPPGAAPGAVVTTHEPEPEPQVDQTPPQTPTKGHTSASRNANKVPGTSRRAMLPVDSGNTAQNRLQMKRGDTALWFFKELGGHSVDSSVVFVPRADPRRPRQPPLPVRPLLRRKSDAGTFVATETGNLVFLLDNTFSWLVDKHIQLDIHLVSGLRGVASALDPTAASRIMAIQPSQHCTTRWFLESSNADSLQELVLVDGNEEPRQQVCLEDGNEESHQQLRKATAEAAHTAVEIVDRVAARVAERQARLGLRSPGRRVSNTQPPPDAIAELSVTDLKQRESEKIRSDRLAALTAMPMRCWTEGRVVEWVGELELSAADAAVIKAAVLEEEINGDDLVDLKPKCVRPSPATNLLSIAIIAWHRRVRTQSSARCKPIDL